MEVIFFQGVTIKKLEQKINHFLEGHPDIEIKYIKQTVDSCGGSEGISGATKVSIWYEED